MTIPKEENSRNRTYITKHKYQRYQLESPRRIYLIKKKKKILIKRLVYRGVSSFKEQPGIPMCPEASTSESCHYPQGRKCNRRSHEGPGNMVLEKHSTKAGRNQRRNTPAPLPCSLPCSLIPPHCWIQRTKQSEGHSRASQPHGARNRAGRSRPKAENPSVCGCRAGHAGIPLLTGQTLQSFHLFS